MKTKDKNVYLIISGQRHGTTTLCDKFEDLPNSISFYEAFNESAGERHGAFAKLIPTSVYEKKSSELMLFFANVCDVFLPNKETISFKIFPGDCAGPQFKETFIKSMDFFSCLSRIERHSWESQINVKYILLHRNLEDSYRSYVRALTTGDWTNDRSKGRSEYTSEFLVDINDIFSFERYNQIYVDWFNEWEVFLKNKNLRYQHLMFDELISENFNLKSFLNNEWL